MKIHDTRSDDFAPLRGDIGQLAISEPGRGVAFEPFVGKGTPREEAGFNHPQVARLLAPVNYLKTLRKDPPV